MSAVEVAMNTVVLPALVALGLVPAGRRFKFQEQEDATQLFNQTMQAAQYFDIDPEWVKEKFGIEVTGPKSYGGGLGSPDNQDEEKKPKSGKKQAPQGNDEDEDEEKPKGGKKTRQNAYSPDFDPFV